MKRPADSSNFYVVGGTVPRDSPSYIDRHADADLLDALREGQFCYVLTSRQMGKSSLMVRAATRLRQEGVAVAALDLTAIGINLTAEQWYEGLLNLLLAALDLDDEMEGFCARNRGLGPLQRWRQGLREIVLGRVPGRIVIFVDEIDVVRSLPFSADEFFAGIRECYNRRAEDPEMGRITFCLLGVATPGDLIRDTRNTPFNIGRRIELTDFTPAEALRLAEGLAVGTPLAASQAGTNTQPGTVTPQAASLLSRVLYWTGGQPYLTQRLCQAVADSLGSQRSATQSNVGADRLREKHSDRLTPVSGNRFATTLVSSHATVDQICADLFLGQGARDRDDNLLFVRDRLLRGDADIASLLDRYLLVLNGKRMSNDETDPLVSQLLLSGIARSLDGRLTVRNQIYRTVFNRPWVKEHMPEAERRRQQSAYRRGLIRAASLGATLLVLACAAAVFALQSSWSRQESVAAKKLASQRQAGLLTAQNERDRANRSAALAQLARVREEKQRRLAEAAQGRANRERETAIDERRLAVKSSLEADAQRRRALAAERTVEVQRLLEKARSLRYQGMIGQRFQSLAAIARAAKLAETPELRMALRNEAIACLSLQADLRPMPALVGSRSAAGEECIGLDPTLRNRLCTDRRGTVTVYRAADSSAVRRLPGSGSEAHSAVRWSDDGRYASIHYWDAKTIVWDLQNARRICSRPGDFSGRVIDISLDGRMAAMVDERNQVHVYELPSGRETRSISAPPRCSAVRFSPDGRRVALTSYVTNGVTVADLDADKSTALNSPTHLEDVAWQPEGNRIAASTADGRIFVWDQSTGSLERTLSGKPPGPATVDFDRRGRYLVSAGYDAALHFWNPGTGRHLLTARIGQPYIRFSRDNRYLITSSPGGTAAYSLPEDSCLQVMAPVSDSSEGLRVSEFSPEGRWLALGTNLGLRILDANSGRPMALIPMGQTQFIHFSPDGRWLYAGGMKGVFKWALTRVPHTAAHNFGNGVSSKVREDLTVGPTIDLRPSDPVQYVDGALSRDGRTLSVSHGDHIDVLDAESGGRKALLGTQPVMRGITASPDGRYYASCTWIDRGVPVAVWDARTGKKALDLPVKNRASAFFSRDARWLITGDNHTVQFWSPRDWKPGPSIATDEAVVCGAVSVAPVGRTLAVQTSMTRVRLYDYADLHPVALLDSGDDSTFQAPCFSPDGSRLVEVRPGFLHVWDLRLLRRQLREIGLDWDLPTLRDAPPPKNLAIRLLPGEWMADGAARDYAASLQAQLRTDPRSAVNANELAWMYVAGPAALRDAAKALPLARRAVELAPNDMDFWNTLGVTLYRLGRYEEAAEALRKSLKLGGDKMAAHSLFPLAVCCHHLGRSEEAIDTYSKACRWRSSHPLAGQYFTELEAMYTEAEAELGAEDSDPR